MFILQQITFARKTTYAYPEVTQLEDIVFIHNGCPYGKFVARAFLKETVNR